MADDKPGRPRVLVRRHVLEIKEDTRDWLEEQLNGLKQAFIAGKVSRSVGDALKGALSHPAGYLSILGAVILAAHTIPGVREIVVGFEKKQAEAAGVAVETFVKTGWKSVTEGSAARTEDEREMYERWINDLWNGIKWAFQF